MEGEMDLRIARAAASFAKEEEGRKEKGHVMRSCHETALPLAASLDFHVGNGQAEAVVRPAAPITYIHANNTS
jgi:hypothetical protein